jgi:hypothetical protein
MTRALAICMLLGLTAGCGGKPLDLGGIPRSDGGWSPGTHSTAIITHQRNAASLHSEGSHLYWTTYDGMSGDRAYEICRCHKDDCAATRQSLFQTRDAGRLLIRNGRAYFRHNGGIVGCHVDDCSAPTVIIARASGAPSVVDDLHVYWWSIQDNALLSCPLTGCDEPSVAVARVGPIIDAAVDDAHFFWTVWESATNQGIRSAPKYGTPLTSGNQVIAQPVISSFILDDGFAYWGQNLSNAKVARTRKTIPNLLEPHTQILASGQHYPHALALDYDVLYWMNESLPEAQLGKVERPVKIMSCILPTCETSIEVLDEAAGGSLATPLDTYLGGGMLVVDAEAIYYIGDVATVGPSPNLVEASIRRLQRRPDR